MAGAIASVLLKLGSLLITEGKSLGKVHNKVESLQQELRQMHSFLRDVEAGETTSANVTTWLADIRGIAQDAESLIVTFILKKERHRRRRFFKRYALILHYLLALYKFGKEIERIQTNIRSTYERKSTYSITIGGDRGEPSSSTETLRQQRHISPHSDEIMSTFGLSEDVKLLEKRLIRGDPRRNVISIVGMGGLGKTTLAKSLYNSGDVRHHFDCFAWVYVSQQFKPHELLHEIREQIIKSRGGEMVLASESNVAEQSLFQLLKKKKYLIVLDDVWTTNVWTRIEEYFPNSKTGSRIVLTTRKREVALHAEPTSIPHELKLLEEEDGWKLFKSTLYKIEKDCPRELEEVGRSILGKCGGLPLAIKLIGGLLSTKKETREAWNNVLGSFPWHLNQDPVQHILSILAMSYHDLPSYLKPCFRYFATFPEGFQIRKKRLVRLWVAENIIQHRGEEELEDIGNDYIEELADRYIIQTRNKDSTLDFHLSTEEEEKQKKITQAVTEEKLGRRNLECSMHDLVREVSLSIARNVDFLDIYVNRDNSASSFNLNNRLIRRLAVHFDGEDSTTVEGSFPNLHSVSAFDLREGKTQGEEIENFVYRSIDNGGFKLLTVLDLEGIYKPRLPNSLGRLIHLRYLGLRRTWLDKLPSSVADLFNLQTLDLKCTDIQGIPNAIWEMQQLRHLYLNGGVRSKVWIRNKYSFESLSRNLRTLCGIFVGSEDCVTDRLEKLTKIRKLAIEGDLNSQGNALGNWIAGLERLEHLKLKSTAVDKKPIGTSSSSTTSEEQSYALPRLGRLRGHSCLTKLHLQGKLQDSSFLRSLNMLSILTLVGTRLDYNPMETLGHLPNLRILRLWYNSYVKDYMEYSSGSFPKLEVLEVCWVYELAYWKIDKGAMPNLRELEINKCNNLRELPYGLEYLTNLKELRLPAMSDALKSRVLPNTGRDWYKIKHIPFISPPLCIDAAPFTASASASASAAAASTSSTSSRRLNAAVAAASAASVAVVAGFSSGL